MSANILTQTRTIATFSTTSTSFIDLLDNTGGNTIAVTLTKAAGTDVLIFGSAEAENATINDTMYLAVNDGTTDYIFGRNRSLAADGTCTAGNVLVTGLGAGSFTFTLRTRRLAASGSMVYRANSTAYITAIECNSGSVLANANTVNPSTNFTFTSTSYTNLLDAAAGSAITTSITKASGASTNLIVTAAVALLGSTADTVTLGVRDGTTDYDVARAPTLSSWQSQIAGATAITGLAAGAYTLTMRVKTAGGQTQNFNNTNCTASISVREIPA